MSIRLRFTLLYNAILAVTLAVFGIGLYSVQSQSTYTALKDDLIHSSERFRDPLINTTPPPSSNNQTDTTQPSRPIPFENFSGAPAFADLQEREIVRVLDIGGNLVASPFGRSEDVLPLSDTGLVQLQTGKDVWETGTYQDQRMLIYSRPVTNQDNVTYILQIARPLTERDRTLQTLATALFGGSLLTILIAFGIGWIFSGITLKPIHRLTQTAQTIGDERDFTRRVDYAGPQDEVGQLATTFNTMLARLQDAYQQVAHSLEMQRNFVADVSHELRTPLTTLRGNLGLLTRKPAISKDEQSDILSDMVDESDRLIRLVNDLLVMARADAGRSLASDIVEVAPLLEETCRQARQLDEHREIVLSADNVLIHGDRDALKQVFLIALDNALKHSTGRIMVIARKMDKLVTISVEDHGTGIAPDKLAHIFERFYRGGDAATIPGFGLGLAIAKTLVEGQSGEICMESELGVGSTLKITFPIV